MAVFDMTTHQRPSNRRAVHFGNSSKVPSPIDLATEREARTAQDALRFNVSPEDRLTLERTWGPLGEPVALYVRGLRMVGLRSGLPITLLSARFTDMIGLDCAVGWRRGKPVLCASIEVSTSSVAPVRNMPIEVAVFDGVDLLVGLDLTGRVGARMGASGKRSLGQTTPRAATMSRVVKEAK